MNSSALGNLSMVIGIAAMIYLVGTLTNFIPKTQYHSIVYGAVAASVILRMLANHKKKSE